MADTAKDYLRRQIEILTEHEKNELDAAKSMRENAARKEVKAAEWRKAIADLEAALVKLGGK